MFFDSEVSNTLVMSRWCLFGEVFEWVIFFWWVF